MGANGLIGYAVRRLALAIPTVLIAVALVFMLVSARGDPLSDLRHRPGISEQTIENREREYHLDDSRPAQFLGWFGDFVRGDWGSSFDSGRPVSGIIRKATWNSLLLVGSAVVLSVSVALALGTLTARRRGSLLDRGATGLTTLGFSIPDFWIALMLQLVLVIALQEWFGIQLFYTQGKYSPGHHGEPLNLLQHLVLPVLALSITSVAVWSRFHRDSMIDELGAPYTRTGRAAGLSERRIAHRHALRNGLGPFVSAVAVDTGLLLGGVVVIERVFAWPGLGSVFIVALENRDYPVLLAWMTIAAIFVVVANLAGDLIGAWLNPRLRT